jgi:hypothetical protein
MPGLFYQEVCCQILRLLTQTTLLLTKNRLSHIRNRIRAVKSTTDVMEILIFV